MRTRRTIDNVYLALLFVELVVIGYDGLFADSTASEWVRIVIVAIGIAGFFGWSSGFGLSWKWLWRLVFLLVCGWFFLYFPFETYRDWEVLRKTIDEFGLGVIAPGYVVFYLFHVPLFYALYSAAFRGPNEPMWRTERLDSR